MSFIPKIGTNWCLKQDGGQFAPPAGEDGGEPIYQNQGQIYLADPTIEPIYQNLPIQPSQVETGAVLTSF